MQQLLITNRLLVAMQKKREQLAKALDALRLQSANPPKGKLKVVKKPGGAQFYCRKSPADKQGTYINKKSLQLAKKLAQKDCDAAIQKALQKQIDALDEALANYDERSLAEYFKSRLPEVQKLIAPAAITAEDYAAAWQAVPYQGLSFENSASEFYTNRGERVRSKSELMIANALFKAKVPYRYEYPIAMKGGRVFHPDFLCLNPHDGREFIWEHFGLMDNAEYSQNAISKLSRYAENGWIPGKNFICTLESAAAPLSSRLVERIVKANFS